MQNILKIGNAQAFWGDQNQAPAKLIEQEPDLDYLTLDYLSEVSLSIMAAQRAKDPQAGYARDFIEVIQHLIPLWQRGSHAKVITNAGGLDPVRCAEACAEVMKKTSCPPKCIGIVKGDDVLSIINKDPQNLSFNHLESNEPISSIIHEVITANAYLGAKSIVEALKLGADIVITGRVADPSLTVAPCVAHFEWSWEDFDRLAQATVAGHLIECGTQVTGGISANWQNLPGLDSIGFPLIEINEDGSFIVTKPEASGGAVTLETVKEQLLYEIGDPDAYLSPDVTVSFLSLSLKESGLNRIQVTGARGKAPIGTYKVSATYRDGFKAEGMLAIFGRQARLKAQLCGKVIFEHVHQAGYELERTHIECLGCGDLVPGVLSGSPEENSRECILRVSAADSRKDALECFVREIAPMVTCGPPGTTGYTSGRPSIRPVYGYWPCKIPISLVVPKIELMWV